MPIGKPRLSLNDLGSWSVLLAGPALSALPALLWTSVNGRRLSGRRMELLTVSFCCFVCPCLKRHSWVLLMLGLTPWAWCRKMKRRAPLKTCFQPAKSQILSSRDCFRWERKDEAIIDFLFKWKQNEKLGQLAGPSQIKSLVALFNERLTPFSSYWKTVEKILWAFRKKEVKFRCS